MHVIPPFLAQQLTLEDLNSGVLARVATIQRSVVTVLTEFEERQISLSAEVHTSTAVGDWLLLERASYQLLRRLDRYSLISRLAAGLEPRPQAIAANVDTLFVVMSCNADFNPSRLERYLAVAFESRVTPVIVLTKADLSGEDASSLAEEAQRIAPTVCVVVLNATDASGARTALRPWLAEGQTVAFVGSSGVGKSTLCNALLGSDAQSTAPIREDDSKGRHTTTARFLLRTPEGAWIIDTPGMRELKIGAASEGVSKTFADVASLAIDCRFRDCGHQSDEGCAVRLAVAEGRLELRRLESFLKLAREAARASRTPWERHQQERRFGRITREAQRDRRKRRGRE